MLPLCTGKKDRVSAFDALIDMEFWKHRTAEVESGAEVGVGTKIWHWSHICAGAKIGSAVILGQNCYVASGAKIGDLSKIQNNVSIFSGVSLGQRVFCGPSVVFTNIINPRAFIERKHEYRPTIIEDGSSLGANSVIVCGLRVGEYAMVGAGSVVTKDIPPFALVVGNPGRIIGWVDKKGNKIFDEDSVGDEYISSDEGVIYRLTCDGITIKEIR